MWQFNYSLEYFILQYNQALFQDQNISLLTDEDIFWLVLREHCQYFVTLTSIHLILQSKIPALFEVPYGVQRTTPILEKVLA